MTRTTISLPNGLLTRLKILAAERGVSMTSLIRGVLEASTEDARPAPRSLGRERLDIQTLLRMTTICSSLHCGAGPRYRPVVCIA